VLLRRRFDLRPQLRHGVEELFGEQRVDLRLDRRAIHEGDALQGAALTNAVALAGVELGAAL
jgi:hypothetical protein